MKEDFREKNILPRSTERANNIFEESCTVENMEAKFGKTLSEEEKNVKNFILTKSPYLGRIVSIDEIINAFKRIKPNKIKMILNKLDQGDVIHMDENKSTILAAYPFSGTETSHSIAIKKDGIKKMFAMCAIDALGICFMYNCGVTISSRCLHCSKEIKVEIKDNKIIYLKPETVVVWCDLEYSCCAATSLCKNINFFSSEEHFKEYQFKLPKRRGHLLEIDEAFYVGKLLFNNRL